MINASQAQALYTGFLKVNEKMIQAMRIRDKIINKK